MKGKPKAIADEFVLQHINQPEWNAIEQGGNIIGDDSGSLIEILKDGTHKTIWSGDGLAAGAGLTVGPDGHTLYISNNSRYSAGAGQVITIDPRATGSTKVPEPNSAMSLLAFGTLGAVSKTRKRKRQAKVGEDLLAKVEIF